MEDLSSEEIEEQRKALIRLREDLSASLDTTHDSAKPVDLDQPIGRLSRMDAIQQQQLAQAALRNQERRLKLVEAALHAIEEGDYGICKRCDVPIEIGRLQARPETTLCIECAQDLERRR